MVKLLPYDPKVEVLWSTPEPAWLIATAAENTMKGIFAKEEVKRWDIASFLYKANHGSPLEHAVICFDISQISRACLDQLARHRLGSFTSSSQHYQDHSDYPLRVSLPMSHNDGVRGQCEDAMQAYSEMLGQGHPKEEARMLLPMATEVRVIWTVNARSLANFVNLRACRRNVMEMVLLATRVKQHANKWFPELFDHVGPDCCQPWILCRQGKMRCDFFQS